MRPAPRLRRSPLTPTPFVLLLALASAGLSGCASKSELEQVRVQLEECRQDKKAAQESAADCRRRTEIEGARWEDVRNVVEEAMPRSLEEFREERQRIVELVPQQVREEVDQNLERFAEQFDQAFGVLEASNQNLAADNERIITRLEETRGRLEAIQGSVESGTESVTQELQDCFALQDQSNERGRNIIAQIQDFDRAYINDRDSSERLRLNRREREVIVNFHRELIASLGAPPTAAADEAEGGEPEAGETESGDTEAGEGAGGS